MTKTKKKTKAVPAHMLNLKMAHAALTEKGRQTRDLVRSIVHESDQPLTLVEVAALLKKNRTPLSLEHTRKLLLECVAEGTMSSRLETAAERVIRFGKRAEPRGAHLSARYFWARGAQVPKRTKASTVDMTYSAVQKNTSKKKKTSKRTAPVQRSAATDVSVLINRIIELESQLADVRSALR